MHSGEKSWSDFMESHDQAWSRVRYPPMESFAETFVMHSNYAAGEVACEGG